MPRPATTLSVAVLAALLPLPAHAHLGHVGELAGHSHWLGLAALAAAAAALALLPRGEEPEETAEEAGGESGDDAAESAETEPAS